MNICAFIFVLLRNPTNEWRYIYHWIISLISESVGRAATFRFVHIVICSLCCCGPRKVRHEFPFSECKSPLAAFVKKGKFSFPPGQRASNSRNPLHYGVVKLLLIYDAAAAAAMFFFPLYMLLKRDDAKGTIFIQRMQILEPRRERARGYCNLSETVL